MRRAAVVLGILVGVIVVGTTVVPAGADPSVGPTPIPDGTARQSVGAEAPTQNRTYTYSLATRARSPPTPSTSPCTSARP